MISSTLALLLFLGDNVYRFELSFIDQGLERSNQYGDEKQELRNRNLATFIFHLNKSSFKRFFLNLIAYRHDKEKWRERRERTVLITLSTI